MGAAAAGMAGNAAGTAQAAAGAPVQEKAGNSYKFYQTHTSPKAMSRLDIYRQSKNALRHAASVGR